MRNKALAASLSASLIIATLFAQSPVIATDYACDELVLVQTDNDKDAAKKKFGDGYIPDFRESRLIVEARAAPYLRYNVTANFRNIPTAVDGMQCIERNGLSTVRPGAYLQPFHQHEFFWAAITARGWLWAKLKRVGELDAFLPPFMLGHACHFNTSLLWQRFADSAAKGYSELD
jgi:hypothetical protein